MTSPGSPVQATPIGPPAYSQTFACEPETAAIGRRLVRDALAVWHLDDLVEPAALVISELVANAARHTSCHSIRIVIQRPCPTRVRVGVVDWSPLLLPVLRPVDDDAKSGRGLILVDAIADRWGCDLCGSGGRPWGKEVWAELLTRTQQ